MITNKKESDELPSSKTGNSSGSRLWSGLNDPRIVRVSKAFGGKDRHSKVSTVRGLRDRRVRLSVPTAIQLYDLQDRLGLSQPSKVVDWLLNAAQHEIDKLPPLHLQFENFVHLHDQYLEASSNAENGQYCLNADGGRQIELGCGGQNQNAGVYNADSSFHGDHNHHHSLLSDINSRGGNQALGGFPYASYYHLDQVNRSYFSQLGFISSQMEMAPATVFLSSPCELDGRNMQTGSSAQHNPPL